MAELNGKTFKDIKGAFANKSAMNFIQMHSLDGDRTNDTLTTFSQYLVFLRTAKGQNVNSFITEKELQNGNIELPESTVFFYDKNGEKCCDLSQIPLSEEQFQKLNFEDTIDLAIEDYKKQGVKVSEGLLNGQINADVFQRMQNSLSKNLGIKVNVAGDKEGYKPSYLRTTGRKFLNFVTRRTSDVSLRGNLNFETPHFHSKEGTEERKIEETEYYVDCISKYVDFIAGSTTKLKSNVFYNFIEQSQAYHVLSPENRNLVLQKNKQALEANWEVLDSIAQDLVASEIVKLMPDMPAKQRYVLNQAYLLRVAQKISALPSEIKDNSATMAMIKNATREPVFRFAKQCRYTPEDVAKLYAQVLQYPSKENYEMVKNASRKRASRYDKNEAIFQLICGSSEQIFVSKASVYISKQELPYDAQLVANEKQATNDKDNVVQNIVEQENVVEPKIIYSNNATEDVEQSEKILPVAQDSTLENIGNIKTEQNEDKNASQDNAGLSHSQSTLDVFDFDKSSDTPENLLKEQEATALQQETDVNTDELFKNVPRGSSGYVYTSIGSDEKFDYDEGPESITKVENKEEIERIGPAPAYSFPRYELSLNEQRFIQEHEEPIIKNADQDLFPTYTPPMIPVNLNEMSDDEIEELVYDYVGKRANSAVKHLAYYANYGKNANPNSESAKFLTAVKDERLQISIDEDNQVNPRVKNINNAIENDIDKVVDMIMDDWRQAKEKAETNADYVDWIENSTTIPKFLNSWYNIVNERELYDSTNKTFRGCFEANIRNSILKYAQKLDKQHDDELQR